MWRVKCTVHTPVGCSKLPSVVNDLATTNNTNKLWAPPVFIPLPQWTIGRRRRMPPLLLMKKDWLRSLFSRFAVETVHNCDCFSEVWSEFQRWISAWFVQWEKPVFLESLVLLKGWAIGLFTHLEALLLGPANFWVANHEKLNLVGSDREFHQNSFCHISFAHCGPRNAVSVPQFCRAEHHEVVPFWWRSAGLRKHPSRHWWKFWLDSLSCGRCPQVQ